ncbi:MAG: exonuclease SbcCD subunit D [Gordonia sp. (in: high G+C Gram-positive bacteria)]|uniref:metallophosphoesterase family protein n=1 Tax=Gordonia sp. (in: high G+C Gram-positive bacteria) TaxID=84139 RepID=UPI0039E5F5FF
MTAALFDLPDPGPEDRGPASATPPESGAERTVTFLHTADWQLGMTRHFLAGEAQHTYNAAREDAVEAIGALARSTGAEFVVVCGDVFDDPRVSSRIIRRTLDALGRYPVPVYLLPGNHDPLDATSVYSSDTFRAACPDNVHVLDQAGPHRVRDGIVLVAAPWTTKSPDTDLVTAQLSRLTAGDDIRIVVGHGIVDEFSPADDPSIVGVDGLRAAVDSGLVDYVALGDRHSATRVAGSDRIRYSGAPEVTDFDHVEKASGSVLQVTLSRGGEQPAVDVAEHRVGKWTFATVQRDMNGAADLAALRAAFDALPDKSRTVVKLALQGTLGLFDHADLEALLDDYADRFAALQIWERHHDVAVVADPTDVNSLDLQGYAAQAADELVARAAADDPDDAAAASSALALLFRLAGDRR